MSKFLEKVKVVLKAVPTYGAAVVAALTFVSTTVVPRLPGGWAVQVGAWAAAALGVVTTVVAVVSRVTPVLFPEDKGLLPATGDEFVDFGDV